jgi:hypothetical protein
VVDVEPAATILLGPSRKEPTLGAQFSAQLTPDLIIFVGFGGGSRFTSNSGWHIGLKPGPHFSPKSLLFVGIGYFKIHCRFFLVASPKSGEVLAHSLREGKGP